MAEFLIRAADTVLADAEKAARCAYRRGDVVEVHENGFEWGRNCLSNPDNGRALFVLKIPDVTVTQAKKYIQEHWDDLFLSQQSRRRFRLVMDDVPQNVRNTIRSQGWVSFTWAQVRGWVEDKKTGLREPV